MCEKGEKSKAPRQLLCGFGVLDVKQHIRKLSAASCRLFTRTARHREYFAVNASYICLSSCSRGGLHQSEVPHLTTSREHPYVDEFNFYGEKFANDFELIKLILLILWCIFHPPCSATANEVITSLSLSIRSSNFLGYRVTWKIPYANLFYLFYSFLCLSWVILKLCMTNENADIVFLTNTTELNNRLSLALFFLCSFQFRHASICLSCKENCWSVYLPK